MPVRIRTGLTGRGAIRSVRRIGGCAGRSGEVYSAGGSERYAAYFPQPRRRADYQQKVQTAGCIQDGAEVAEGEIRMGRIDGASFTAPTAPGLKWNSNRARPDNRAGEYFECAVSPDAEWKFHGGEFRVWIPAGVSRLRGLIVRQHGGANGKRFAHGLQFQALAKKHDFGLMGTLGGGQVGQHDGPMET